jgi:hypothetical protein
LQVLIAPSLNLVDLRVAAEYKLHIFVEFVGTDCRTSLEQRNRVLEMIVTFKRWLATLLVSLLSIGLASPAQAGIVAGPFTFDPDGAGPDPAIRNVVTLQWSVGQADAVGGNLAVANFLSGKGSTVFYTDYQAKLVGITDVNGTSVVPPGLNVNYEDTVVSRLTERVVSVTGNSAQFVVVPSAADFFEIYYHKVKPGTATAANDLAGTGFNNGSLIYQSVTTTTGEDHDSSFDVNANSIANPVALDQHATNNYPAIKTVTGTGSSEILYTTSAYDPNFFQVPTGLPQIIMNDLNTTQSLPYKQVDPAGPFTVGNPGGPKPPGPAFNFVSLKNLAGIGHPGPAPNEPGASIADIGTVNGLQDMNPTHALHGGPDVMFQAEGSTVFAVVPEPSTMALSFLALGAFGAVRLLKSRRGKARV